MRPETLFSLNMMIDLDKTSNKDKQLSRMPTISYSQYILSCSGVKLMYIFTKWSILKKYLTNFPSTFILILLVSCSKDLPKKIWNKGLTSQVLNINNLKEKLNNQLEVQKDEGVHFSYYFQDLNTLTGLKVNDKELFIAASLSKLPLLSSIYLEIEGNPHINLKTKITYSKEDTSKHVQSNADLIQSLQDGIQYSLEELIRKMIVESDNHSTFLLSNFFGTKVVSRTYDLFSIKYMKKNKLIYLTPKEYSKILRDLFFSHTNIKRNSQHILSLLKKAEFKGGLKSIKKNKNIEVANKFGVRKNNDNDEKLYQLHDCGVIFYPGRPYILCIMTKGPVLKNLIKTIALLSNITFRHIEDHH